MRLMCRRSFFWLKLGFYTSLRQSIYLYDWHLIRRHTGREITTVKNIFKTAPFTSKMCSNIWKHTQCHKSLSWPCSSWASWSTSSAFHAVGSHSSCSISNASQFLPKQFSSVTRCRKARWWSLVGTWLSGYFLGSPQLNRSWASLCLRSWPKSWSGTLSCGKSIMICGNTRWVFSWSSQALRPTGCPCAT